MYVARSIAQGAWGKDLHSVSAKGASPDFYRGSSSGLVSIPDRNIRE